MRIGCASTCECALGGVNVPNRIRRASNSLPSASVNGPLIVSGLSDPTTSLDDGYLILTSLRLNNIPQRFETARVAFIRD